VRPYLKNTQSRKGWGMGKMVWQARGPEFKLKYCQQKIMHLTKFPTGNVHKTFKKVYKYQNFNLYFTYTYIFCSIILKKTSFTGIVSNYNQLIWKFD
jgi:hypothetical protein